MTARDRAALGDSLAPARALALALALAAGCPYPLEGRLAASRPLGVVAPHATASIQAECGHIHVDRISPIRRAPYLQQITARGGTLSWTSTSDHPERVEVRLPDEDDGVRMAVSRLGVHGGTVHRAARLGPLTPGITYCYELRGYDDSLLYGPVAFRSAPSPGSDGPVDLIAFGDSGGGGADQRAVRDQMLRVPADLVLHLGDLAYPSATTARLDARVFDMYEALLRSIPIFPTIGNHDRKADEAAPYLAAFALPQNGGDERWYSFDWGPLHVAALDTDRDLEEQARWLDEDLARSDAPWEIVIGHHPPYSSGWHGSDLAMRRTIAPVLARHGVRLALAGHDHHYERTHPIDGVTYIVSGGGGHSIRAVAPREHSAVAEAVLHFLHLHVTDERLTLLAIDARGSVFDELELER
jgi:hypothetical protein